MRKDGSVVDVEVASHSLTWDGRDARVATAADITERRRTEIVQSRLAAIVDSSGDAIMGGGLDGTITSWSDGAQRLFGYRADEAIGRPVSMLAPHERSDEPRRVFAAVRSGESVTGFETVRVRKDGRRVEISLTVSPVRDAAGDVAGFSAIARDITEQVRTRQELADTAAEAQLSASRLEAVLAALPVGVFITDALGEVQVTNPAAAAIWGGHTPRVGIDSYGEYRAWRTDTGAPLSPDDWPIARAIRTGKAVLDEELEIAAFDGSRKTILASGMLFRDAEGQVLGGVAVNLDVTDRKEAAAGAGAAATYPPRGGPDEPSDPGPAAGIRDRGGTRIR